MPSQFSIQSLGTARIQSPLRLSSEDDERANYVGNDKRVVYAVETSVDSASQSAQSMGLLEKAGPRERIYFDPSKVHAGIVTCGGLCPGLNNVIRSIVMTLRKRYGVRRVSGVRYGYRGFLPELALPLKDLRLDDVMDIHRAGGTILGSSRGGGERTSDIVDAMEQANMNMLFVIGGDGTQKGAERLAREITTRGKRMSVIGVPKTIDNDLSFVERSFGFETAVSRAVNAVQSAHTEARGALNGIGIVKLMGRESGFIAAHTALASNVVDFVLIPEVPFQLEGDNGFLAHLERRLDRAQHAVVVVAEGAGQQWLAATGEDASGNRKLGDIGPYLKRRVEEHFSEKAREISLKYIDPSYIIRATPADPADAIYCARLGSNAVHAAMAGRTACLVGQVNNRLVHVPISLATSCRNRVSPNSPLWRDVIEATGQRRMVDEPARHPSSEPKSGVHGVPARRVG